MNRVCISLALLAMLAGHAVATAGMDPSATPSFPVAGPAPELLSDLRSKHASKVSGIRVLISGVRDKVEEAADKVEEALGGVTDGPAA